MTIQLTGESENDHTHYHTPNATLMHVIKYSYQPNRAVNIIK